MGDSCVETSEAPEWLLKLEKQREKLSKARLGHDSGAGAPCNSCGDKCPGLDLHFWRKVCRACHCRQDVHDVPADELAGWAQFQLLGTTTPTPYIPIKVKIKGIAEEPVKVDWVPPHAPQELVSEYMSSLGELAPVSGSEAARRRRANLRTQLPPHDAAPSHAAHASRAEQLDHGEYLARVRSVAAGRGHVVRLRSLRRLLPGVALQPAGAAPPDPPRTAPPAVAALGVGPARLRSALAHPDLYDRLLAALTAAGLDPAADASLGPVLRLRERLRHDPSLLEELPPPPPAAADEGVVFGLGGEMWAWRREAVAGDVRAARVSPQYVHSSAAPPAQRPQLAQPLRPPAADKDEDDVPPPPLNYDTYPGALPSSPDPLAPAAQSTVVEEGAGAAVEGAQGAAGWFGGMSAEEAAELDRRLHAEGVPCRRCGGALFAGEVGVVAARAGAGSVWHPRCFTCGACGELLADLVYCYLRGEVYCARDLAAMLGVPRCAACDELIFARPYTAAEGRAYHVQHFCCYRCDAPLGGAQYVPDERAGLPVCLECWERHSAERCGACGGTIGPQQQGVSLGGAHWHAECFACGGCARSLLHGRFTVRAARPYCSTQCARTAPHATNTREQPK